MVDTERGCGGRLRFARVARSPTSRRALRYISSTLLHHPVLTLLVRALRMKTTLRTTRYDHESLSHMRCEPNRLSSTFAVDFHSTCILSTNDWNRIIDVQACAMDVTTSQRIYYLNNTTINYVRMVYTARHSSSSPRHRTSSSSSNRTRLFRRISAIRRSSLSTLSLLSCNRGCMQIISRECVCNRSHKSQPGPWRHGPTSVGAIAAAWVHLTSASSSQ